jgi:hypothetical protein
MCKIFNRWTFVYSLIAFLFMSCGIQAQNVVIQWNNATINAVAQIRQGGNPPSRTLFLVHTAMFDAWAAYDENALGTQRGNTLKRPAAERTDANKAAAMSFAAYRTLLRVFSAAAQAPQRAQFAQLMIQLGYNPNDTGMNTVTPSGIGNLVANDLMNYRENDGANQLNNEVGTFWTGTALVAVPPSTPAMYGDYTGYIPVNDPFPYNNNGTPFVIRDPNRWQPLIVPGATPGSTTIQTNATPQWALIVPFALTKAPIIKVKPPARYPSRTYTKQANETLRINANLTSRQKAIAEYWSGGAGTVTSFGYWNQGAQFISARDHHTQDDDVKFFFILNNFSLDSQIAGNVYKNIYDSERPISAVRFLYNGEFIRAWAGPFLGTQEILGQNFRTYTIPGGVGEFANTNQAGYAAGAAYILRRFTGSDRYGNSVTIPQGSSTVEPGTTPDTTVVLSWPTFKAAVDQSLNGVLYSGAHFRNSILQGQRIQKKVAQLDYEKSLTFINDPDFHGVKAHHHHSQ